MQVPEQTSLILKTVNDGDILVKNVKGDFTIRNVNGHIELQDITGPVSCKTVNGHIRAAFRENPAAACAFTTVNGDLDVSFTPDLAADFQLKTLNGEIFSDFPVSYLPAKAEAAHSGKRPLCLPQPQLPGSARGPGRTRDQDGNTERRYRHRRQQKLNQGEKHENHEKYFCSRCWFWHPPPLRCGARMQSSDRVAVPFSDPGKPGLVKANLINGGIIVKGYDGKEVIVEAKPRGHVIGADEDERRRRRRR